MPFKMEMSGWNIPLCNSRRKEVIMENYKVFVTETLKRECEIEADSEEEALEILEEKYNDSKIILDYSDLVDVEFSNCQYTKKEIQILNEISNFCQNDCAECNNCVEDDCVLYRIEKIIEDGFYAPKCCLCGKYLKDGEGNNAEPVKNGTCCDECNDTKVISARLEKLGL